MLSSKTQRVYVGKALQAEFTAWAKQGSVKPHSRAEELRYSRKYGGKVGLDR